MLTVRAKPGLRTEDRKTLLEFMKRFSSAVRYAYKSLLSGGYGWLKYRPLGTEPVKKAGYKYPSPECSPTSSG